MDAHVHLDSLNPAQRRAVSLGDGAAPAPPLLIIAGAGSGKTNTLAHRVAHLMVPQRFFTHGQSSTGDRHVYAARTRFVPDDLLKHFERRAWPLASPAGASALCRAQDRRPGEDARDVAVAAAHKCSA